MSYDPTNQYRCDIVRSRSIRLTDDLVPAYANIINGLCPCSEIDFIKGFNTQLKAYLLKLGSAVDTKALNNHRTETAKTLFGMYYIDGRGMVQASERTRQYLIDRDQPAFFKDICYKLQFPNGMTKPQTVLKRYADGISVFPCRFLIEVMQRAENKGILLTIQDIGYYVLNSKDALSGKSSPSEVANCILKERKRKISRSIDSGSFNWQHITGIITYLEYANLIIKSKGRNKDSTTVRLNNLESSAINIFVSNRKKPLEFKIKNYIESKDGSVKLSKKFQSDWDKYNSELSDKYGEFYTSPAALGISTVTVPAKPAVSYTAAIGAAGEKYVFDYEVDRVSKINAGYGSLVKDRTNERGIGFDIESVCAKGANPSDKIYIEVKTTSRVTPPSATSSQDMVNMTHNEWEAACKYLDKFYLYRVYLVKGKVLLYIIERLKEKSDLKLIDIVAPSYQVKFDAADKRIADKIENN